MVASVRGGPPGPPLAKRAAWPVPAWISTFLILTSLLQWSIPYPIDDDTAYHFSVSQLIGKYGILHTFPWTPFSWQYAHYADKEFLFHLLFLPVGVLGFIPAQRIVGVVAETAILAAMYLVLRAERVRLAGVWTLVPLASSAFVFRFGEVRPHLLSIALTVVLLWALSRERLRLVAVAAVLYPLSYVAFWQIALMLVVAAESARVLGGQRMSWKPAAVALAGITVGLILHPNTVNLLGINWIHMTDILFRNAWGQNNDFSLGNEYAPFPVVAWVRFLALTVLLAGAAVALAWRDRRNDSLSMALALTAVMFGLLTVKTARFVEYFVPLSVLAFGMATRAMDKPLMAPALLAVSLFYALSVGLAPYRNLASLDTKSAYIEPETARAFAQSVPVDAQVFTCGWEYTGSLMVALPERRFIVAADPTLFYKQAPNLYAVWNTLPRAASADVADTIRTYFRSRFVICRNIGLYSSILDRLRLDPSVKTRVVSPRWVLFDLQ